MKFIIKKIHIRFTFHRKFLLFSFCIINFTHAPVFAAPNIDAKNQQGTNANAYFLVQLNHLHELWSYYKYTYIKNGRVISLDENNITTSEGQSYAMLRAVWADDHQTFKKIYEWTQTYLKRDEDRLFAWKYKHDKNAATDADCDIALALILAAEKILHPRL